MDISNNMGAQAQRDLLDKLGIKSAEEVQNNSRDTLGQEEFLTLMTAQLQNQDPMEPMDNGDFIAQMAQFSTVTGITDMANSMKAMADELKQFRVASISNIMGNSVLVPGDVTVADRNGELHGVFELDKTSIDTRVNFVDAQSGELLKAKNMGPQATGLIGFEWRDLPAAYRDGSKEIRVEVMVNHGEGLENLQPSLFSKVVGAALNKDTGSTSLELENEQTVDASSVLRFRM
ncbi:MAG: flagellar hook capping FlgD N-terminal domain-containing protein [Paracoccaceae bacterium]|nr:flagellar biosynthesis protein FlgJ [Marinovum sp.]MDG2258419.1 flagellar hook capping FlgD N-terminal domain-containing protein [Paracoccaceae bacterium]